MEGKIQVVQQRTKCSIGGGYQLINLNRGSK